MSEEDRLVEIERRLDRLEGRLVSIGVNPSGMIRLGRGVVIESVYDYKADESVGDFDPPLIVEETGCYTASRNDGKRPVLHFHGAR